METTPASTLFSRTNEPASRSPVGFSSNLHSTNYTELTTLRHERFHRRALLESQAFAPIVGNARFATRIHDMLRFVVRNAGIRYDFAAHCMVCRMHIFGRTLSKLFTNTMDAMASDRSVRRPRIRTNSERDRRRQNDR